jgi:predicted MFS family arabinose efflux permease
MGFDGTFKAAKDYLQPILKQAALALPIFVTLGDKRTPLMVGAVYFTIYILSSIASRQSHRIANWQGGEDKAGRLIWYADWVMFVCLIPLLWFRLNLLAIVCFIMLMTLQNFWRPIMISRINAHSTPEMSATVLSIESQSRSLATMLTAPILGWTVDKAGAFWPVAIVGALIATAIILTAKPMDNRSGSANERE